LDGPITSTRPPPWTLRACPLMTSTAFCSPSVRYVTGFGVKPCNANRRYNSSPVLTALANRRRSTCRFPRFRMLNVRAPWPRLSSSQATSSCRQAAKRRSEGRSSNDAHRPIRRTRIARNGRHRGRATDAASLHTFVASGLRPGTLSREARHLQGQERRSPFRDQQRRSRPARHAILPCRAPSLSRHTSSPGSSSRSRRASPRSSRSTATRSGWLWRSSSRTLGTSTRRSTSSSNSSRPPMRPSLSPSSTPGPAAGTV
jgi:hypothetical protein